MKILVINGPNLGKLPQRDKALYGFKSIDQINEELKNKYQNIKFRFIQTNHEGIIIDELEKFGGDAIVINPGAYTHTSIAIRDALESIKKLKVEVHLSDIYNREDFRKINYICDVVDKTIIGKQDYGYFLAVEYIIEKLSKK